MKTRLAVFAVCVTALLAMASALLPPGVADALLQATPTLGSLTGGLNLPTTTPGGGLAIPTATPGGGLTGGLTIPTSTPSGGGGPAGGPALPVLSQDQLEALNLQPGDVPAEFGANQEVTPYTLADTVAMLDQQSPELADQLEAIGQKYGWGASVGVKYTSCQPNVPVSEISSEVGQLASPEAARAFLDDPDLSALFSALGYTLQPVSSAHGVLTTLTLPGTCFPQETEYSLTFEYWGMLLSVSMTANADTDPALVTGLLDQLAPLLVGRVDGLAGAPFPPTPVPGGAGPVTLPQPTTAALPPTPAGQLALPPTQPVAPPGGATLADIQPLMPTLDEVGLPAPPFALNQQLSVTQTLDQLVAFYQQLGLADIAAALAQNGQQNGMIGQVTQVFDTGSDCPQTIALSLEVDVSLFATAEGAQAFLMDPNYRQALSGYGMVFEDMPDGSVFGSMPTSHACGTVFTYTQLVAHGRFVVSTSVIGYPTSDVKTITDAMAAVLEYMGGKIDQAGLQ